MDDLCKKITIQIPLEKINEISLTSYEKILKSYKGKQSLNFTIWDTKEKIELNVPSRNTKVKVTSEFLNELEKNQVNYKLN